MVGLSMTNKEYRDHEGISKSSLFKITKSPLHFKYSLEHPQEDTPALLFGRATHKYVLEEKDFFKEFAIAPSVDRRTNKGKEEWALFIENNKGKDVISADDFEIIKGMAKAIKDNSFCQKLLNGDKEQSFFWVDSNTEEPCKCRPDCLTEIAGNHIIIDYKTTDNAEQEAFMKSAITHGYDLQAGMYTEGMKANTGNDYAFIFIAQEKKPPYAINILQADEYFLKEGNRLFHDLLEIYHDCKVSDNWYGYEGADGEVANMSLPKWLMKEFE